MVSGCVDVVDVVTCGCDRCGRQLCGCGGCGHERGGVDVVTCGCQVRNGIIPGIKDVDIILGELSASAVSTNRNYAAFKLSLERGKNADVAQVGQAAINYIGGICCLLPEVADDVLEGLRQKGGRVRVVRVPESDDVSIIPNQNKSNALFGWLVTMLYKNTNEDISSMVTDPDIKAPFDAAGYDPRGEGEDEVLSLFSHPKHVLCYWGYAQLGRIKESVLKAHEVENLHRAVKAVSGSEMPRFFRILGDGSKYHMVEKSMFPTLIAVSEQIMRTAGEVNFRPAGSRLSEVDYHVAMHRNQFADAVKAHVMQFVNDRQSE
ncbi:hypothetical protein DY000_02036892 [Brassica cretica]|uniref:Uncharacterized protein n=1 Tax=Brassica cretica TaxID=69181 RepID=A0ABQ7B9N2_BRACR|nr:hypothetical protein DY000_02036892 [Brassica cretica]